MKDGAIVGNSGHFNVEIDLDSLGEIAVSRRPSRDFVEEVTLPNGRKVFILADGRLVNLSSAEGHPATVMDMSFANQALCAEYVTKQRGQLPIGVHTVPKEIDQQVARRKLDSMGMRIDVLTPEQQRYLSTWMEGT